MRLGLLFVLPSLLIGQELTAVQVASGITDPTDIQHAGDGSGRLFLVRQAGVIRILREGTVLTQPFLDISSRVNVNGEERGLLGLAFSPTYKTSGRFFVNYINAAGSTVISQFRVTSNPDIADSSSESILLTIPQPFANHNGGQLRFGPDGFLYIGMGDGGSAGDPQNNAQRLNTLLGKMLRVDTESQPGQIRIPPNNPFVNTAGARGEIWAYGLRNPWRFSFDRAAKDLYIADVGQNLYEEIDFQPSTSAGGENYGWRTMEGSHCYNASTCATENLTLPVFEYTHAATNACSITGGFVYRGNRSPGMRGTYIYGDFCNGRISGLERVGILWANRQMLASGFVITTFGEDEAGEIYVANSDGRIYRLDGPTAPRFSATGVTNAASFQPGLVAGSLATVFASGVVDSEGVVQASSIPLPTTLNGVSVTVEGISVPIHSIANTRGVEQINFQVPWSVAGRSQVQVVVTRSGASSSSVSVPLLTQQPGVFSSNGTDAIVVHNTSYTLATEASPLVAGEYAFVYAEGIGAVSNTPATGAGSPSQPLALAQGSVAITLGGVPCEVQFAGLAPGFAGVYQVNFRVPAGVSSGRTGLVLRVNSVDSPTLTVPVR